MAILSEHGSWRRRRQPDGLRAKLLEGVAGLKVVSSANLLELGRIEVHSVETILLDV